MHPGVNLTSQSDTWPRDLSSIVICIPSLLRRSTTRQAVSSAVYIFDVSDSSREVLFLGGVRAVPSDKPNDQETFLPEVKLEELRRSKMFFRKNVQVSNKVWTVAVVALEGTYEPALSFVILGSIITFIASVFIALSVCHSARRMVEFSRIKAQNESEKASLILENAREATRAERELNDFIGHEVRNPVAAAMTACSFVKAAVNKEEPLTNEESRQATRQDVEIIDNSLRFVNDLLRNMLDMHRASHKQLDVDMMPTDLLHDVLEPVGGMLHQRNGHVKVVVDCPRNLMIMTDRLRLKQIILNLGRNSAKFVEEGFIRLRAEVVDDHVELSVEDSGPGIPMEKRKQLFNKFQESLDVLGQGTVRLLSSLAHCILGLEDPSMSNVRCDSFTGDWLVSV
jgi:signal transduction histidine kinase